MRNTILLFFLCTLALYITACGSSDSKQSDLPEKPDRWVSIVELDSDSMVNFIGKTKDYLITSVSSISKLHGLKAISVGGEIEGVRIGAIKCSYHSRDASYGGEQFMWRGRWSCMAGKSEQEVENAVGENGEKYFNYIYISPVGLSAVN